MPLAVSEAKDSSARASASRGAGQVQTQAYLKCSGGLFQTTVSLGKSFFSDDGGKKHRGVSHCHGLV